MITPHNLYDKNGIFGLVYKGTSTEMAELPVRITAQWSEGDLWYDTTNDVYKVYNGSSWVTTPAVPTVTTTEHGAGAISTARAPSTTRRTVNGVIITEIKFDLTGLAVKGDAANDVIGLAAGGAAYIGRNVVANNGVIYRAELACLEAPGEGTATITSDIDIATNSSGTLEYDGAAGTSKLINAGTAAAGTVVVNDTPALTANDYFYLVEADTAATTGVYNAGQYILTLYGHALV